MSFKVYIYFMQETLFVNTHNLKYQNINANNLLLKELSKNAPSIFTKLIIVISSFILTDYFQVS